MGERLRPLSSSWMAPYSLAAQLTAQAGQSMGNAFASLGNSIGQGIQAGSARRENERRYNEQSRRQQEEFALRQSEVAYRHDQDALELTMALGRQHAAQAMALVQGGLADDDPKVVEATEKAASYVDSLKANLMRNPRLAPSVAAGTTCTTGSCGSPRAPVGAPSGGPPVVPMGGEGGPALPVQAMGGDLPAPPKIPELSHNHASMLYRDAEEEFQAAMEAQARSPKSAVFAARLARAKTRLESTSAAVNAAASREAAEAAKGKSGQQTPEDAEAMSYSTSKGRARAEQEAQFEEYGQRIREYSTIEPLAPDMAGRAAQYGRLKTADEERQLRLRSDISEDRHLKVEAERHAVAMEEIRARAELALQRDESRASLSQVQQDKKDLSVRLRFLERMLANPNESEAMTPEQREGYLEEVVRITAKLAGIGATTPATAPAAKDSPPADTPHVAPTSRVEERLRRIRGG